MLATLQNEDFSFFFVLVAKDCGRARNLIMKKGTLHCSVESTPQSTVNLGTHSTEGSRCRGTS